MLHGTKKQHLIHKEAELLILIHDTEYNTVEKVVLSTYSTVLL